MGRLNESQNRWERFAKVLRLVDGREASDRVAVLSSANAGTGQLHIFKADGELAFRPDEEAMLKLTGALRVNLVVEDFGPGTFHHALEPIGLHAFQHGAAVDEVQ
jgi:hypothetical protein